jgi:hypothetical protein
MSLEEITQRVRTLPDAELHQLLVRIVEEEDQRNGSLPALFGRRIEDKDPTNWHSLETVKRLAESHG